MPHSDMALVAHAALVPHVACRRSTASVPHVACMAAANAAPLGRACVAQQTPSLLRGGVWCVAKAAISAPAPQRAKNAIMGHTW